MPAMKVQIYQVMHVLSMVLLTAIVFQTFANPDPARKGRTMMLTGCLSLLMLVGGFGVLAVYKIGFPVWVLVKVVCWFALSAVAGVAYRAPSKIPLLRWMVLILVAIAVGTVYFRHGVASEAG